MPMRSHLYERMRENNFTKFIHNEITSARSSHMKDVVAADKRCVARWCDFQRESSRARPTCNNLFKSSIIFTPFRYHARSTCCKHRSINVFLLSHTFRAAAAVVASAFVFLLNTRVTWDRVLARVWFHDFTAVLRKLFFIQFLRLNFKKETHSSSRRVAVV